MAQTAATSWVHQNHGSLWKGTRMKPCLHSKEPKWSLPRKGRNTRISHRKADIHRQLCATESRHLGWPAGTPLINSHHSTTCSICCLHSLSDKQMDISSKNHSKHRRSHQASWRNHKKSFSTKPSMILRGIYWHYQLVLVDLVSSIRAGRVHCTTPHVRQSQPPLYTWF